MAKLLVPSRNRPKSIDNWLKYISRHHGTIDIVLADGSDPEYKKLYKQIIEKYKNQLQIDYRPYDASIPVFDRILNVLENESSEFFIMAADDDYPMLDLLKKGESFLKKNSDYVAALGAPIKFSLIESGQIVVKFNPARPITNDRGEKRVLNYSKWPFPTTYAVTRREHLINRYKRLRLLSVSGFYDYVIGMYDCCVGKIKAFADIGYICTKNYNHSYLRPKDKLFFLRHGEKILEIRDLFYLDLINIDNISSEKAKNIADKLIKNRIAALLGRGVWTLPYFEKSKMFNNQLIQRQYHNLHALFTEGEPIRNQMYDKLLEIVKNMESASISNDNCGEDVEYETILEQIEGLSS